MTCHIFQAWLSRFSYSFINNKILNNGHDTIYVVILLVSMYSLKKNSLPCLWLSLARPIPRRGRWWPLQWGSRCRPGAMPLVLYTFGTHYRKSWDEDHQTVHNVYALVCLGMNKHYCEDVHLVYWRVQIHLLLCCNLTVSSAFQCLSWHCGSSGCQHNPCFWSYCVYNCWMFSGIYTCWSVPVGSTCWAWLGQSCLSLQDCPVRSGRDPSNGVTDSKSVVDHKFPLQKRSIKLGTGNSILCRNINWYFISKISVKSMSTN